MSRVSRHRSSPLYRQVAEELATSIRTGEFAAGDRLPAEAELAERYGVHRLTVRQALAELVARGLIRTVHGRGSFVAYPPIRHTISGQGEASLTRTMRRSGHVVTQQLLQAHADDNPSARRALRTRGRLRCLELLRFVDEVPWSLTRVWLGERRFRGIENRWSGDSSLYDALAEHFGVHMRRSDRTIWTEAADAVDAEHLLVPVGSPLLVMSGLNVTADGTPIMFAEHRARGDRVQIAMTFHDA